MQKIIDWFVCFFEGLKMKKTAQKTAQGKSIRQAQDSDPLWLKIAFNELGVAEIKGDEHNKRIQAYHKVAMKSAYVADEVPWCSSFVNWCMKEANERFTKSGLARSWLRYSNNIGEFHRGAICIIERGSGWQGHVFFALAETDRCVIGLGGNQGDKVSIKLFNKDRILGYRWP